MGVIGLSTFIAGNPQLLREHRLHDCPLVIDGNNWYHSFYYKNLNDFVTGGEYDRFYTLAAGFFDRLRQCNISPYIVVDGSLGTAANVLPSSMKRASEMITRAFNLSRGQRADVLPMHTKEVFFDVLHDLKIPFVTSDFEADNQVACLANYLNCPVLSMDSDFYIYDIKGGFICTSYLEPEVRRCLVDKNRSKPYNYLKSQIYFVDNFLKSFSNEFQLNRATLCLCAALMSRDTIEGLELGKLRKLNAEAPRKMKCNLFVPRGFHHQMVDLILGLRLVTVDQALDAAVRPFNETERIQFKDTLLGIMQGYSPTLTLQVDLLGLTKTTESPNVVLSFTGSSLPQWFLQKVRNGEISTYTLQVAVLRYIVMPFTVENFQTVSSSNIALYLRQVMYGILIECGPDVKDPPSVMEIDRLGVGIHRKNVLICRKLTSGTEVPYLDSLPTLSSNVKRMFLAEVLLGIDAVKEDSIIVSQAIPEEWQLFVWILVYWLRAIDDNKSVAAKGVHVKQLPNLWHLDALLITGIYYNAVQINFKVTRRNNGSPENAVSSETNDRPSTLKDTYLKILSTLEKPRRNICNKKICRFSYPSNNDRCDLDVRHAFAQFQRCLLFGSILNDLLDCPVPAIRVAELINFPFLYNICCRLKYIWKERDKELISWLGPIDSSNPIRTFFRDLRASIISEVVNVRKSSDRPKKKKTRRGRRINLQALETSKIDASV